MGYAFNGTQPARAGNRSQYMSPHGVFRCAGENAWVSIACRDDGEWRALADAIDPALAADARFEKAKQLGQKLEEGAESKSRDYGLMAGRRLRFTLH